MWNISILILGGNVDFNSMAQTATITAGTNSSTINITVINDRVVEENETFNMTANVPTSRRIMAGAITKATVTIIDSTSTLHHYKWLSYNIFHCFSDQSEVYTKPVPWVRIYGIYNSYP